jgi:hypothetical protein
MSKIIIKIDDETKEYTVPFDSKLSDIKELIKKDFNIEYPFDLDNISSRIYRNFGKMFLKNGVIQASYDGHILSNFLNEGQIIELTIQKIEESKLDVLMIKVNKPVSNGFVLNMDDFPPLC